MRKGRQLKIRISIVIFALALLWGGLLARGAYLQLFPQQKLSNLKNRLFERAVTLKPRRGNIYGREGRELAISIPSQSLFADPQNMREPYYAAKRLSKLLGLPREPLLKRLLNKKRRFVWVKRHLSEREIQEIKSLRLEGLHFIKESKRFYANDSSLSQTLGFTGIEGQGLEGIEKQYDEVLKGSPQKILIQRDARGRPLFMDFSPFIEKAGGFDVHLTIDSDLQFYLEKGLKRAIDSSKAESAMGLILSAKSSEVLALANLPNYNPNQPRDSPAAFRRNRALTDIFEPGSALKTFAVAGALKKGASPSQTYPSLGGRLKIGDTVITEADTKKKLKAFLNLSEILALSSNVGMASMALDIGPKSLRKSLWDFGFGRKTGIDFPGEAKGLLRQLPWRPIETATVSFGHGVAATALQTANAYSAIANGGLLNRPFLVKKIRNPHTGEEKVFKKQTLRRVLSFEEAMSLTLMLVSATERHGTGAKAAVAGYWTAGKTGTAQKVDFKNKGYKEGEYISSFAGFIPARNPKFTIYLVIDGAKDNFYASSLAAPLFSQIASYAVRRAGLSPTLLKEDSLVLAGQSPWNLNKSSPREKEKGLRRLLSLGAEKAQALWRRQKGAAQEETQISADFEKRGQALRRPAGLKAEEPQSSSKPGGDKAWKANQYLATGHVPDLRGLSAREALRALQGRGLRLAVQGSGRLIQSRPSAKAPLPENKKITLIFN